MADTPNDTQSKMQAAVDLLVENSTPEQVADALYEGHMAAFHRREAANAPMLPEPDAAMLAALKAHLTDGVGHMDLQRELLSAHVALHKGDWRGFCLGALTHYKCALGRVPAEAVSAALAEVDQLA
jgi:hypothetical protein